MKQAFLGMGLAVMAASMVLAQAQSQTTSPSPTSTPSEAMTNVRRAIDKGNAQWSEGWLKGDAAMVAAIFAEDGVQLAGNGKIFKGPREIAEHQKAIMQSADPGVKVTVTTAMVWLDGDSAYETGKYKYEYTEKGKPSVDEGRYVTIWKRQKDDSWKLVMDMGVPQK
jgi:uncharacterized protein (TIGR02246 family)